MAERGRRIRFRRALLALSPVFLVGSCSSVTTAGCAVPPELLSTVINSAAAPVVAGLIRHSRNAALKDGGKPIPEFVRTALEPYFGEEVLQQVRWATASKGWTVDTVVREVNPRLKAVTMQDVIVFLDPAATNEMDVWIHELLHVQQVKNAGGIDHFSRTYIGGWRRIEPDTVKKTKEILKAMGRQPSPSDANEKVCR